MKNSCKLTLALLIFGMASASSAQSLALVVPFSLGMISTIKSMQVGFFVRWRSAFPNIISQAAGAAGAALWALKRLPPKRSPMQ